MKSFFNIYQYLVPLVLFPLSYYLWFQIYNRNHQQVLIMIFIPVIFAYIIPGIGTNALQLWEINTRFRMGNFRIHHGFVLGSGLNFAAWLCYFPVLPENIWLDSLKFGLILGSVFGFWSWLYDIYAIRSGFIKIYTKLAYEKRDPSEIALAYAPHLFGGIGFAYGFSIRLLEYFYSDNLYWSIFSFLFAMIFCLTFPLLVYFSIQYWREKNWGLTSYKDKMN